jgi:hypothetical protein
MKYFVSMILVITFFTSFDVLAQWKPIPAEQVPAKIEEVTNSSLKDSIFWSTVGFFRNRKYRFTSITENTIYVNDIGIYYVVSFANDRGKVEISSTYFMPYNRNTQENADTSVKLLINEHLCRCEARIGYVKSVKLDESIDCQGETEELNIEGNISVICADTEAVDVYISKYYQIGKEFEQRLRIIPVKILPF